MFKEEFTSCSSDCLYLMRKNDYFGAKSKMENFLKTPPFNYDIDETYFFQRKIDKKLFHILMPPKSNVNIINENYCTIFNTYAYILIQFDEFLKAKEYYKLAFKLNPIDVHSLLSLVKIYDIEYDFENIEKTLRHCFTIVHDEFELFSIYNSFANYYRQMGEHEIADLLYRLKNKKSFESVDKNLVLKLFDKYDLQLGFDEALISKFNSVACNDFGDIL